MDLEKLLRWVQNRRILSGVLSAVNVFAVVFVVASFAVSAVMCFVSDVWLGVRLCLATGIPFLLVSLMRRVINAPRPYEIMDFAECAPKRRVGMSFPSRHVFSAFAVGTALCFIMLPLGIVTLCLGVALGACRVLLGIHFPRDVIAGAVIGVVTSVIGMLIF